MERIKLTRANKKKLSEIEMPRSDTQAKVVKHMLLSGQTNITKAIRELFPDYGDKATGLARRLRENPVAMKAIGSFDTLLDMVGCDDVMIAVKLKEHLHARTVTKKWDKAAECFVTEDNPDYVTQEKAVDKLLKLKNKYPKEVTEETVIERIMRSGGDISIENAEEISLTRKITKKTNN